MKRIFIGLIFFFVGCKNIPPANSSFYVIGSRNSNNVFVYLCGLIDDFAPDDMNELNIIDLIGKQLDIKFLAIIPKHRCSEFNNLLCWPHADKQQALNTYNEVIGSIKDQPIKGFIGFSNGGFFLNAIAQFIDINKPIISIGSGGQILNQELPSNTIYLLIGKKDKWHYESAINFYNQSKTMKLKISLIEYAQGHEIPVKILKELLENILTNKS